MYILYEDAKRDAKTLRLAVVGMPAAVANEPPEPMPMIPLSVSKMSPGGGLGTRLTALDPRLGEHLGEAERPPRKKTKAPGGKRHYSVCVGRHGMAGRSFLDLIWSLDSYFGVLKAPTSKSQTTYSSFRSDMAFQLFF